MSAVLITGATGKQGGAVINHLIRNKAPFKILALTRDANSGSAQRLLKTSSNIQLLEGNLDNPKDIFKNAKSKVSGPIWGVFSVQVCYYATYYLFLYFYVSNNPPGSRLI